MDRLKKPKDFLEKLRLTDSDYQDSGMINHIADLLERYSTEQCTIPSVVGQSGQLKCVWCGNDESKDILPQLCNECFKKGCKAF
jgi:hypothetical protein